MSSTLTPIAVDFAKIAGVLSSRDEALLDTLLKRYREELKQVDELADELEEDNDSQDEEEGNEESQRASLLALSQLLGKAKQDLQSGIAPAKALSGLGKPGFISQQQQKALQNLLSDSGDDKKNDVDGPSEGYASAADVLRCLITGDQPARRVAFKFMYGYALQYLCLHIGEVLPHDQWHDLRGSSWAKSLDKALKSVGVPAKTLSISKHLADRGSPFNQVLKYSDSPTIGYLALPEVELALAPLRDAKLDTLDEEHRSSLEDIRSWLQTCADTRRDLICFGT